VLRVLPDSALLALLVLQAPQEALDLRVLPALKVLLDFREFRE
jgi:hypothetical protein